MSRFGAALLICAVGTWGALWSPPVVSGLFDDEEARAQIAQLRNQVRAQQQQIEARITELESIAKSRSMIDLFNQLEVLKVEVAKLRGMQEVINNELENAQKRQRDLYQDADARLRKMEGTLATLDAQNKALTQVVDQFKADLTKVSVALQQQQQQQQQQAATAATTPPASPSPEVMAAVTSTHDSLAEQRAFDAALSDFRAAKFREASAGFSQFLRAHPRSPLAPSAQYWLGNSQYAAKDFRGAINTHRQLLAQYPDSNRVPDAMLTIGNAFAELDEMREARRVWQDLIRQHPNSDAAARARARLAAR